MNQPWQGIIPIGGVPPWVHPLLAQDTPAPIQETQAGFQGIVQNLSNFVPNLIAAILILIVGWIVALIAKSITKGLLNRTRIDNQIAQWFAGGQQGAEVPPIEKWIASAVYWIIIVFTVVAVLQTLKLEVVSLPLNNFLDQILIFLPKIFGAAILLGVAWLLASLVKLLTTRGLRALGLDERLGEQFSETPPSAAGETQRQTNQFSLSETMGNALYWFIFLLFLPSILSTLGLEGTLRPVQELLNEILAILPDILAALVIAAAGWLVAQVVRRIVTNLLSAAGTDQLGARFGLQSAPGGKSLSWIIGTTVYVLILIPVGIAALNALQIEAISEPAIAMLNQILDALPKIFTAALILMIAYVIGQFVKDLVTNILASIGFNNVYRWIGIPEPRPSRSAPTPPPAEGIPTPETGSETVVQPESTPSIRTPSELVGIIAFIAIFLFATVAATNVLQFEALTTIVTGIIVIAGQILAGLIVFAVGLYFANLAFNLITSSRSRQSQILAQAARIAIIAFSVAMALQQMGIAGDIVNLAFGLLLGAIAVAIALAFGLGSRDIAAGQVREWLSSFKGDRPPGPQ
ncbi:mechanosensitive ion channel [Coleofasciculus sp. F4-SAH-05]|uniref:mechanosensitive ion channel n=1 Tax=Coleofasciculus sp. F4-SAH-05 TaxID=3069525 RepID=UPI0033006F73